MTTMEERSREPLKTTVVQLDITVEHHPGVDAEQIVARVHRMVKGVLSSNEGVIGGEIKNMSAGRQIPRKL